MKSTTPLNSPQCSLHAQIISLASPHEFPLVVISNSTLPFSAGRTTALKPSVPETRVLALASRWSGHSACLLNKCKNSQLEADFRILGFWAISFVWQTSLNTNAWSIVAALIMVAGSMPQFLRFWHDLVQQTFLCTLMEICCWQFRNCPVTIIGCHIVTSLCCHPLPAYAVTSLPALQTTANLVLAAAQVTDFVTSLPGCCPNNSAFLVNSCPGCCSNNSSPSRAHRHSLVLMVVYLPGIHCKRIPGFTPLTGSSALGDLLLFVNGCKVLLHLVFLGFRFQASCNIPTSASLIAAAACSISKLAYQVVLPHVTSCTYSVIAIPQTPTNLFHIRNYEASQLGSSLWFSWSFPLTALTHWHTVPLSPPHSSTHSFHYPEKAILDVGILKLALNALPAPLKCMTGTKPQFFRQNLHQFSAGPWTSSVLQSRYRHPQVKKYHGKVISSDSLAGTSLCLHHTRSCLCQSKRAWVITVWMKLCSSLRFVSCVTRP
ncbi:hypothetical protein Pelo_17345 [Pelomyxa schiedti]|nr:hypothetical protein Pelo_17345 [Pelomyxa schiedti]